MSFIAARFSQRLSGRSALGLLLVMGGLTACSSPSKNADGTPTDSTSTDGAPTDSASTAGTPNASTTTSDDTPASSGTHTAGSEPSSGMSPVEPATPTVLADGLVFPARLCLGADDDLFFPNRVGYPLAPGTEELWTVSRSGGTPRRLAALGSVTGCTMSEIGLWVSSNEGEDVVRVDERDGGILQTLTTPSAAIQVASNATELFASLRAAGGGAEVLGLSPNGSQARTLWSRPGAPSVTWLKASASSLVFSANDYPQSISWIVHVELESGTVRELFTSATELGAVDAADGEVFFTDHGSGTVRRVARDGGDSTIVAPIEGAWSLLHDAGYLYVGARPDYCAGTEGKLYRISLADGETVVLADGLSCPSQIVADDKGIYWTNSGTWPGPDAQVAAPADGSVLFLPR